MASGRRLDSPTALQALAERLGACPEVTRFDRGADKEAWTLAHAFSDLEESFARFLGDLLPRLTGLDSSASETYETLMDVGEELRHVLYHIKDPRFYNYLHDTDSH